MSAADEHTPPSDLMTAAMGALPQLLGLAAPAAVPPRVVVAAQLLAAWTVGRPDQADELFAKRAHELAGYLLELEQGKDGGDES